MGDLAVESTDDWTLKSLGPAEGIPLFGAENTAEIGSESPLRLLGVNRDHSRFVACNLHTLVVGTASALVNALTAGTPVEPSQTKDLAEEVTSLAWLANGRQIVALLENNEIRVFNEDLTVAAEITAFKDKEVTQIEPLADSPAFAVKVKSEGVQFVGAAGKDARLKALGTTTPQVPGKVLYFQPISPTEGLYIVEKDEEYAAYLADGEPKLIEDACPPFGDTSRAFQWFSGVVPSFPKAGEFTLISACSQSVDLLLATNEAKFEPNDESTGLPLTAEEEDVVTVGASLLLHKNTAISPLKSVDRAENMPIWLVLTQEGRLLAWQVVNKQAALDNVSALPTEESSMPDFRESEPTKTDSVKGESPNKPQSEPPSEASSEASSDPSSGPPSGSPSESLSESAQTVSNTPESNVAQPEPADIKEPPRKNPFDTGDTLKPTSWGLGASSWASTKNTESVVPKFGAAFTKPAAKNEEESEPPKPVNVTFGGFGSSANSNPFASFKPNSNVLSADAAKEKPVMVEKSDAEPVGEKKEAVQKEEGESDQANKEADAEDAKRKAEKEAEQKAAEEAARKEVEQEAERKEAERKKAEQEAERKETERKETERKEAERKETERKEAERKEAEQEAKRKEAERKEADRKEAEEAVRKEAEEAKRKEDERKEAEQKEAERKEAESRQAEEAAREASRRALFTSTTWTDAYGPYVGVDTALGKHSHEIADLNETDEMYAFTNYLFQILDYNLHALETDPKFSDRAQPEELNRKLTDLLAQTRDLATTKRGLVKQLPELTEQIHSMTAEVVDCNTELASLEKDRSPAAYQLRPMPIKSAAKRADVEHKIEALGAKITEAQQRLVLALAERRTVDPGNVLVAVSTIDQRLEQLNSRAERLTVLQPEAVPGAPLRAERAKRTDALLQKLVDRTPEEVTISI